MNNLNHLGAWKYPLIAAVCTAAVGGIAGLIYLTTAKTNPFPKNIRQSANFKLYYPSKLPSKLQIDKKTFSLQQGVVTFVIQDGGHNLYVSQQATPTKFDVHQFQSNQIHDPVNVATSNGEAVIGTLGKGEAASILTVDTWILLTSTPDFPKDDLQTVAQSLKPAK